MLLIGAVIGKILDWCKNEKCFEPCWQNPFCFGLADLLLLVVKHNAVCLRLIS